MLPTPASANQEEAVALALLAPRGSVEALGPDLDTNDPYIRAALRLAAFADVVDDYKDSEQARRTRSRIGAAAMMMRNAAVSRGSREAITPDERAVYLIGIAAGLTQAQAAELVPTVHPHTWYDLKKRDPSFEQSFDDALDARTEPVLARMADIALFGDETMSSTVRAADLVLRNSSRRQRDDLRRHADLQYSGKLKVKLEIVINTPTPD